MNVTRSPRNARTAERVEGPQRTLYLPLKAEYFDAIVAGEKQEEYRLYNEYWCKRLVNKSYSYVVLTKGYPKRNDQARRHVLPYRGYEIKTIQHPHFGLEPAKVFAIDVRHGH